MNTLLNKVEIASTQVTAISNADILEETLLALVSGGDGHVFWATPPEEPTPIKAPNPTL